nr:hypothetical protein [Tanacetum cinerariifolium]
MEILPESTSNSSPDQTTMLQPHSSEVKIQDPMLDHQDKYMTKAQFILSQDSSSSSSHLLPCISYDLYVLFPVLSDGSTNSKNNNKDALVDGKEHDDDIQKSVSPDIHSSSCGDQTRKQGDKTENKDKGKSPVITITGFRDLNEEFEECINNSSNEVNAAVNPIPTTRIHKDHPTSQIIGDMSLTTQTRSMARAVRDQGGISQLFNEDFHTCVFSCFLSQEEPNRVYQALKDPSWIEAMQEELLQFKMQKVVAASIPIPAAKPKTLTITAAPAVSTRRRKGVVIKDLEEELQSDTPAETPSERKKEKES